MLVVQMVRHSDQLHFFFFIDTATPEIYTFPYTTLFRSLAAVERRVLDELQLNGLVGRVDARNAERSEEHTSELQSQSNLVCRLLLEKKKCALYGLTWRQRRFIS